MRGKLVRNNFQVKKKSACKIQNVWRGYRSQTDFLLKLFSVLEIQRLTRGKLVRNDIQVKNVSACKIQSVWRGYQSQTYFLLKMLCVIKIQRFWQKAIVRKQKLENELLRRSMLLQVVKIQKLWRVCLLRNKFLRTRKGFTSLQCLFRGWSLRKRSSRRVFAAARRIAQVNKIAQAEPQMVLGSRTSAALSVLRTSKRLTEIIAAIRTLEVSTRLSQKCCIAFSRAGAYNILYNLIRSCNRSLPHVELLQFILMTLLNVSKYPELISRIATSEAIDILLDLIQMFRDKDSILCFASTLLEVLVLNEDILAVQCQKRENLKRITGVHNLCLKKVTLIKKNQTPSRGRVRGNISEEMSTGIRALGNILNIASNLKGAVY